MLEKNELNRDYFCSTIEMSQFLLISNLYLSLIFGLWRLATFFYPSTFVHALERGIDTTDWFLLGSILETAGEIGIWSFLDAFLAIGFKFWLLGRCKLSYGLILWYCCWELFWWFDSFLVLALAWGVLLGWKFWLVVLKFFYIDLEISSAIEFLE
jgi:hypothetical protein